VGIFEKPPKSGIWHISYFAEGKRRREKIGGKSDALLAYSKRKQEVREGRYVPPRTASRALKFSELSSQAMESRKLRLAPRTYSGDLSRLGQMGQFLDHLEVDKITPVQIEDVLGRLRARGLCGSSANRHRSLLSSVFAFGVRMGLIRMNPVAQVKRFKESASRVRWLRPEEEEKLRAAIREDCPEREAEFDLALYTGMRRGEQFTLKWANVDLERGQATVFGKTGRRFITLSSKAKAALETLSAKKKPDAVYVCAETQSDEQRDWRQWFEEAVKKARITDFRWHDLRHGYASRLVMAGVDLRTVQELLGHKNIQMTTRYAHLSPDHKAAAVEKIV